jgi:hypothetical protein
MRQLMGHLGGLRDPFDMVWHFSGTGHPVTSADLLSFYRDLDDVNAPPGTTWNYNNGGYLLLSAALERISGRSLEDLLRSRIFEPIGMYDTMLRRFDGDFVENSATLHTPDPGAGFQKTSLGTALDGAGGIVSTVDDMLRWLAHLEAPQVGSAATWSTIKSPQTLANGTSTGYGLGLMTGTYRGIGTLSHAGGVLGGNSQMLKVPSAGLDVAIMVNRHDVLGMELVNRVLDECIPSLSTVPEASTLLASGTFRSPSTGRVIQLYAKDAHQIACIDGVDMPMQRSENGRELRPTPLWSHIKQIITLDGDPTTPSAIHLSDFGNPDELNAEASPELSRQPAILGRYHSQTTRTIANISEGDQGPQLSTVGRFGSAFYDLECMAQGVWRARSTSAMPLSTGGILSFDSVGRGFRFSNPRTRSLPFQRSL